MMGIDTSGAVLGGGNTLIQLRLIRHAHKAQYPSPIKEEGAGYIHKKSRHSRESGNPSDTLQLCRTVPVWTHRIYARNEIEGAIYPHL